MIDEYKTLKSNTEGLFKDKGSKFFAYAFPIQSEEDARFYLETVKRKKYLKIPKKKFV